MDGCISKIPRLVERLDHGVLVCGVDVGRTVALTKPENGFDDREFGSSGIETCVLCKLMPLDNLVNMCAYQ